MELYFLHSMFQSFVEPKKNGLPYNVNEMTHEYCFYLKALSRSLGSNFSKTTENQMVKMTDIKTVKVDKCSPYTFSFKTSYSQENYKKYTGCNRRNVPYIGRVFLMLNHTEKPQNTYIQS
jgi:hypothetical protein